jgi:parallel beta-helix repeat protein
MKKVTYCLIVLFITLMVIASTLEAATEITSLPYNITAQGSYIINQNLKSGWNGIKVQANNVTIDLNGYSISGNNASGGYGIYMSGRSNVEIRNGTIRNFGSHGIYEDSYSGHSHRVINVRVMNNKGRGIYLLGGDYIVKDCTVSNNADGILVGNGSTVSGNTAYGNGNKPFGIGISVYSYGSTISGNTTYGNGSDGINVGNGCTVIGNTSYNNGGDGIFANYGCTVKNNNAYGNQQYGIGINGYTIVDGNASYTNNLAGGFANMSGCPTCTFGINSAP